MNKTKAKALIRKLNNAKRCIREVQQELKWENILDYAPDYIDITIKELKEMFHIKKEVSELEGKEFKKEEYKIELKLVALLSVNDINDLKDEIPALVKKKIESYNYPYIIKKDKIIDVGNMNMRAYIRLNISKYDEISEDEKAFMNNEVAQVRKERWSEFTDEQSNKINIIYRKMENEIANAFNNSPFFKKELKTSRTVG